MVFLSVAENVAAFHKKKVIRLDERQLNVKVMPCSAIVIPEGDLEDETLFLTVSGCLNIVTQIPITKY